MITFKCKMCGGDLTFEPGASVAECPYCGTNQTLPKLDDDKRANLYDRANHFRRQNEFDKAMAIYEQVLAEDRTDAEAYWSLVLCRYGIEYVEDPASHKRVPTVNRVQYASILADEDYKSALAHADAAQRRVYEAEANAIAEIQKGILDISRKEAPFDVFICYKETDANGRRTPDSVLANDMYHQLTKEGFKVFFSRITLEDKIGTAYEPYIFAALNSAKVMVVLGTKPEYFNAVWVKNEWSRYLALIKNGADKTLVPAYRDMDPYDLPEEFAHLQAQDMGKLGFMQDLIRGIKKIAGKSEAKEPSVVQQVVSGGANIENLMMRARLFMEDGNWSSASEYLDKVLDENAEYSSAYVGKVQVQQKLHKQEELASCLEEYEKSADWQKALRFATPDQRKVYEGYVESAIVAREEKRNNDTYTTALNKLIDAVTPEQCEDARKIFQSIPDYRDSAVKQNECNIKASQIKYQRVDEQFNSINAQKPSIDKINGYKKVAQAFRLLGDNQDAQQRADSCMQFADETSEAVYQDACGVIDSSTQDQDFAYALSVFRGLGSQYKESSKMIDECIERRKMATTYRKLNEQVDTLSKRNPSIQDVERWESLSKQYHELGGLWDAENHADTCNHKAHDICRKYYDEAVISMKDAKNEWDLSRVAKRFEELGDFQDSAAKRDECERLSANIKAESDRQSRIEDAKQRKRSIIFITGIVLIIAALIVYLKVIQPQNIYNSALAAMKSGNYDEAISAFSSLGEYKDAAARVGQAQADQLFANGSYSEALTVYNALDAAYRTHAADYEQMYTDAAKMLTEGDYDGATASFQSISGYNDADTQAQESRYQKGVALLASGDYDGATAAFQSISGYNDADTQALESQYQKAAALNTAGKYDEAYTIYAVLTGYKDVDSLIENDDNIAAAAAAAWRAQFDAGNTVQFGRYEQDNNTSNGVEAIKWIVLANDGDTATLISKYALDARLYNTEGKSVTWETCTLRKWLNGDFLNAAFSAEEQARLETVTVTADKNPEYDTDPGNDTQDKVFLLSIDEVNRYFASDDARVCMPTKTAVANGAYTNAAGACWWWLRSPGLSTNCAAKVDDDGSVFSTGFAVNFGNGVVRPVVALRLS